MANFNKDLSALREYVRTSDCTDMVHNSDGNTGSMHVHSIAQALRARTAILVPVINFKNDGGYSDALCEIGRNEHWEVSSHTVDSVVVTIPADFGSVVDKFEVRNGAIYDLLDNSTENEVSRYLKHHPRMPAWGRCHGGDCHLPPVQTFSSVVKPASGGALQSTQTISNIDLSAKQSTRMFVLANSAAVRQDVKNRLQKAFGY